MCCEVGVRQAGTRMQIPTEQELICTGQEQLPRGVGEGGGGWDGGVLGGRWLADEAQDRGGTGLGNIGWILNCLPSHLGFALTMLLVQIWVSHLWDGSYETRGKGKSQNFLPCTGFGTGQLACLFLAQVRIGLSVIAQLRLGWTSLMQSWFLNLRFNHHVPFCRTEKSRLPPNGNCNASSLSESLQHGNSQPLLTNF